MSIIRTLVFSFCASAACVSLASATIPVASEPVPCDSMSSNLRALGQQYFNVDSVEFTEDDIQKLDTFYTRLVGIWKGRMTDAKCPSAENQLPKSKHVFELKKLELKLTDEMQLRLRSDMQKLAPERSDQSRKVVSIHPIDQVFLHNATGVTTISIINTNTIYTSTRSRSLTHPNQDFGFLGGALKEHETLLTLRADTLLIERQFFTNGYYHGKQTWLLNRH